MVKLERQTYFYKENNLYASCGGKQILLKEFVTDSDRPIYLYNTETVKKRIDAYKEAFKSKPAHIHYAVKANSNIDLLKFIKDQGVGADVVSIGEFNRAQEAGFDASEIIFSGVGKSKAEIRESLEKGCRQLNCESLSEFKRIGDIAKNMGIKARVGVRINPDITVETHPYIATGFRENKFGVPLKQLSELIEIASNYKESLKWVGLSCHIGSQIMNSDPLVLAAKSLLSTAKDLSSYGIKIDSLDIGGGLGVDYQSDDEQKDIESILSFGREVSELLKDFDGEVFLEPGRSLVARSGILLARVEYVKSNGFKNFIVVNTGMHHLMRPSLYQAYHKIVPLSFNPESKPENFDIVGPICESSDVLGYDRMLPRPLEEDWVAILDTGAYGMSMVSGYNHHPFPFEKLI